MRRFLKAQLDAALDGWRWRARAPRTVRQAFHYEQVLGTSFELQVVAQSAEAALGAERAALAEVDRLESILSGWSPDSELSHWLATINADVRVSPELAEVLSVSAHWRERTRRAFDPGVQACISMLRSADVFPLPDEAYCKLVASLDGPLWLADHSRCTARRLTRHPLSLDAIAKGYIVSSAAACAHAVDGVTSVLLNFGGDIQHRGRDAVAIGIADPFAPAENAPVIATVGLHDAAMATSGGYRRGFSVAGRRVSHLVDPRTGHPVDRITSASVFAPDCTTADALSTAFSVMEPEESLAFADTLHGVGCLIVTEDGHLHTNPAWQAAALPPRTAHRLRRN